MKHIFLVNSFSLREKTSEMINKINKYAIKEELDYLIEVNDINNSTEDIIKKYNKKENIIYAIGGDGVINRVLNSIVGTKNILGFIPCGTGNDFYAASKELLNRGINEVDVVEINDRYFINIACFGIDADIGNNELIVHSRFIPKSQRYNAAIVKHFSTYEPRYFKVTIDGVTKDGLFSTICVCNARYYGGGYKINPFGIVNDGLFDVIAVNKMSKLKLAGFILKARKGKHIKLKSLKHIKTDNIIIKSEYPIRANVDGEVLEAKTFKIKMHKDRIRVYFNPKMINELR